MFDDRRIVARAALIPSGEPHALQTTDRRIFYALVEPFGVRGNRLARCARELSGRDLADLVLISAEPRPDPGSLMAYTDRLICSLTPPSVSLPLSPYVVSALVYLDRALEGRPSLADAAHAASISPSRLTHLFSAQVGIPFRRFVLWLRLARAAEQVWSGTPLTEAAIAAGFSDMAHLSRACRSTFGVTPTTTVHMRPVLERWPAEVNRNVQDNEGILS